jgi:predicted Zn-dependent protease
MEAGHAAVEHAERYGRMKYVVAGRLALGSALLALGDATAAAAVLRQASAEAESLKHPPSIWRTSGKLAEALAATGDDSGAEAAAQRARTTIDSFAGGLSDVRRDRFLTAPQLAELLSVVR